MTEELAHSPLGPSRWPRFVRCPGSVQAEEAFPDTTTVWAAEGTAFHHLMAVCLELGFDADDFCGKGYRIWVEGFEFEFDNEMADAARDGIDYLRGLLAEEPGWKMYVETRVDISPWTREGEFGTSDVLLVNERARHKIVWDWKYGKGVPVYAHDDYQTLGYCLGAWQTITGPLFGWDPSDIKVTVMIEQPRIPGAGGVSETTMVRVLEFGDYVRRQTAAADRPNAPRHAGDKQCRDCRANTVCGTFAEWNMSLIGMEFDDLDTDIEQLEPPEDVTPDRRSTILRARPLIDKWLDGLHASAYRDAELGDPVPRLKLVEGRRPARKFMENQEHKVEQILRRELGEKAFHSPKMLSPAQAQDEMGKVRYERTLARFVNRGQPKPVLVPVEDRRKALVTVGEMFDDLTTGSSTEEII